MPLSVTITATPNTPAAAPSAVSFAATVTGGTATGYAWSLGDGTSQNIAAPVNTYAEPGTYLVQVTVIDASDDTAHATIEIEVTAPNPATITATPSAGNTPLTVDFSATYTGASGTLTYLWSFGDGTTATVAAPTHVYTVSGTYTARVVITDSDGTPHVGQLTFTVSDGTAPLNPNPAKYVMQWLYSQSGAMYAILWERIQYQRRRDANRISVEIDTRWDTEGDLATDLIGTATYVPLQGYLSRQLPLQCPWRATLFLDGWDLQRYGVDPPVNQKNLYPDPEFGGWPHIDWITLKADFTSRQYDIIPDSEAITFAVPELERFIERTERFQPSLRRLGTGSILRDTITGNPRYVVIGDNPTIPDTVTEWTYLWIMVPHSCWNRLRSIVRAAFGYVNSVAFDPANKNFAAGTMLFKNIPRDLTWYYGPDGNKYYDIPFLFHERNITVAGTAYGWNYYQPNDGSTPQAIYVSNAGAPGPPPYKTTDLNALFKPP